MPRDEDAIREEEAIREEYAHMHATKREKSSNIPVLPIFQIGYEIANMPFKSYITNWLLSIYNIYIIKKGRKTYLKN